MTTSLNLFLLLVSIVAILNELNNHVESYTLIFLFVHISLTITANLSNNFLTAAMTVLFITVCPLNGSSYSIYVFLSLTEIPNTPCIIEWFYISFQFSFHSPKIVIVTVLHLKITHLSTIQMVLMGIKWVFFNS